MGWNDAPLDLACWPGVDARQLPAEQQDLYRRRETAITRYAAKESTKDIALATGIPATELPRLARRCLRVHPDGRLFGFRGLVPYLRVARYERLKPVEGVEASGRAGAFTQLLERHPALEALILKELKARRVLVLGDPPKRRIKGLEALHAKFLKACREEGLALSDYPLAQKQQARQALSVYVRRQSSRGFTEAARLAGAEHMKGATEPGSQPAPRAATRPLERVEFDGHRIDLRLRLAIDDPAGPGPRTFEIERVWLLVALDVFSRAVLAHHLVLDRQYSGADVLRTLEKALAPHRPRAFAIPKLAYPEGGGFPNAVLPELAHACWDEFHCDNAKAHLAEDTLRGLCEFIGCSAHLGPFHDPDERPFIERFFGTFTRHLAHRLPGAAPSSPAAVRRMLLKTPALVTLEELEDLAEVTVAGYNGTPHASLLGKTPLEALRLSLRQGHAPVRWLLAPRRQRLCLLQTPRTATVRGSLPRGVRPYVHLYGARYTSPLLAAMPDLLGQAIRVHFNPDDMRTVRAFLADGTELGTLRATHPWTHPAHTLKLRQEIQRLRREGKLAYGDRDDPVEAYLAYQAQRAKRKRQAANKLAEARRVQREAPPSAPPPPPTEPDTPLRAEPGVKPRKLSIGSGHVF